MRVYRYVVVVAAITGLLSGCTGDDEPQAGPSPVVTSAASGDAGEPSDLLPITEGPAAAGAAWPDGLTAKLVAVERVPNSWGADVPKSMAIVRVTVEVRNGTGDVLPMESGIRRTTLLHGGVRVEAEAEAGYSYHDPAEARRKSLSEDGGTRIPVGKTLRFVESSTVPVGSLGELTLALRLPAVDGERETFYLTGVQGMLKTVR
ncbi:hypothetical protein OOJ91_12205 [Micromonospora lupini]|uniref:hypothetical protein n=1 Tax=Micromonospora lupini TaxID=285679 RepID=UPI00224D2879|nr:hypothetical protein [Micromonospora lupini]MCX5066641.1 hypothetical protein [Micromonospora lupini]